jgi:GT2 family glycosyltransferase
VDTLAVVISYNDWKNTLTTVQTLVGQADIVVWDNASTDGTVEKLLPFMDRITLHVNDENALWTPACNQAIQKFLGGHQFVMLSNNDISYWPTTVSRMENAFSDPTVGIVGPVGSSMGGQQDYATYWGGGKPPKDRWLAHQPTKRAGYVAGASFMFRPSLYEKLGPLDDEMPLGADDHDYCLRAKDAGYAVMICGSAYIGHQGHASARHASSEWEKWAAPSWAVFNKKWDGYFLTEKEAVTCHWNGTYTEGWDVGTGWLDEDARARIWAARGEAPN